MILYKAFLPQRTRRKNEFFSLSKVSVFSVAKFFLTLGLILLLSGCAAPTNTVGTSPASPTPTFVPPTVPATSAPTETIAPTATSTPTLTATPAAGEMRCPIAESICIVPGHFIFQRPLDPAANNKIDQTYRYGTTQDDTREPHHGIDFPNAQGTRVLAVGDGLVVVAGDDKFKKYGWVGGFYGNLVVIEHQVPGYNEPVYTLYGHLFKVIAQVGQQVKTGDLIGLVGSTGIAIGSHLHLEVRIGKNDYKSTRNPELWLAPPPGMGVLAGRVLDARAQVVKSTINVQRLENGKILPDHIFLAVTYAHESLNGDDVLAENFAVGELAAGEYRLTLIYNGKVYEKRVKIAAGMLTVVEFRE